MRRSSMVSVVVVMVGVGLAACAAPAEEEVGSSSDSLERTVDANVDFLQKAGWKVVMAAGVKDAIPSARLAQEERRCV